jgi:hypothetical protein
MRSKCFNIKMIVSAPGNAFRSISEMGAMLTMLTTGIKSGPSSGVLENGNGNGGNASAGSKGSTAGKPPGGISSSSKKVKNHKLENLSIL